MGEISERDRKKLRAIGTKRFPPKTKPAAAPAPPAPGRPDQPKQMEMTPDGGTLCAFIQDWAFVTIIRGPWGSGKSVACCGKLYLAACLQEPDYAGVRRTRWFVVRNTYPDLQETTIKTWLSWFPEEVYGPLRRSRPFRSASTWTNFRAWRVSMLRRTVLH